MPKQAKYYLNTVIGVGIALLGLSLARWHLVNPEYFLACLFISLCVSTRKLRFPGIPGTVSFNLVFILIGLVEFSFGQAVLIGATAAYMQCVWRPRHRPAAVQVAFNMGAVIVSISAAYWIPRYLLIALHRSSASLYLLLATFLYFWINTVLVAGIVCLSEAKPLELVWKRCYLWSLSYYLIGGTIAGFVCAVTHARGWELTVFGMLVLLTFYWAMRRSSALPRDSYMQRGRRRFPVRMTVQVSWVDRHGDERRATAVVVDVSESGAQLKLAQPVGAPVACVSAPHLDIRDLGADVRYCSLVEGAYLVGLEFHALLSLPQLAGFVHPAQTTGGELRRMA